RVTYHDACHLGHAQGITREPREILSRIEGIDLVELESSSECCGSAGIYNILYPENSKSILDRKTENILKTNAQYVVMGNPGCLLQIQAGLIEAGRPDVQCLHTVDLLSMCDKL
ncbi:MAG: (Fe-S)-binding protein, partial [Planctomycetes bacterium]|nr:(Fe-S)-binding protein [Planctomycetota bacterium]